MASSSVPSVPKTAPRRNMKRIMLAKPEDAVEDISEESQLVIVHQVCDFIKRFETRVDLDKVVVLGFNSISRRAEQCDEDLKIVLLNAQVKPEIMTTTLSKLCVLKKIPVCRLENFRAITDALRPLVKGLKPTCAALGILAASPEEFRNSLTERLPTVVFPAEPPALKRARLPPPPCPEVDVKKFYCYLSGSSQTQSEERSRSLSAFGDTLFVSEGTIPMVEYDSFIGSKRSTESHHTPMDVDTPRGKPSKYKQPVMRFR